jgi:hypothetical protein
VSYGKYKEVSQRFWIPQVKTMMRKAGAAVTFAAPETVLNSVGYGSALGHRDG